MAIYPNFSSRMMMCFLDQSLFLNCAQIYLCSRTLFSPTTHLGKIDQKINFAFQGISIFCILLLSHLDSVVHL